MDAAASRPAWVRFLTKLLVVELVATAVALLAWRGATHERREQVGAGWGPVLLIADSAPDNQWGGIVLFVGCIAAFATGVLQFPKWWSPLLVGGSVLAWIV
jgi:hypothetical protein